MNRYAYVLNNPLRYTDLTGHWVESAFDVISLGLTLNDIRNEGLTFWNAVSLVTDVASVALPIVPAGASHVIRAGKLANKAVNAADSVSDAAKVVAHADDITSTVERGVFFFGDDVLPYIDQASATLGRANSPHFFAPLDDVAGVRSVGEAARESGMAPSVAKAYVNNAPAYGVSFPTEGLLLRVPNAADAGGWPHYLPGGKTAVRTADPNGGFLVNSTREFVTPGGGPMPRGSVLFRLEHGGAWTPLRRW